MRGTDHDPGIRMQGTCQIGDGRGRHRSQQQDIDARSRQTGLQRRLEHITGDAGVLAYHHLAALACSKYLTGGPAQFQNKFRGDGKLPYPATNAIGTKKLSCHIPYPLIRPGAPH